MRTLSSLALLALASCWSAAHPNAPAGAVDVEVASVSLAGDCPVAAAPSRPSVVQSSVACSEGHDCSGSREDSCEQTTLQLSVRSTSEGRTRIAIKHVELLDASGSSLGTMTPRNPTRWIEGRGYVTWNEAIDARQHVTASYALGLPVDAGPLDVTASYRVRVTLSIGGEDRTIEKQATVSAPAIPEPGMVT